MVNIIFPKKCTLKTNNFTGRLSFKRINYPTPADKFLETVSVLLELFKYQHSLASFIHTGFSFILSGLKM